MFNSNQEEKILKLSKKLLEKAVKRANKNLEDLTEKSFLRDLFD